MRRLLSALTFDRWIGILGLVVSVVAILVPDARQWVMRSGLFAWFLVILLFAAYLVDLWVRPRLSSRKVADLDLIEERLGDWRIGSDFHRWVTAEFNTGRVPVTMSRGLYGRLMDWRDDPRRINERHLRNLFESVQRAGIRLHRAIADTMWSDGNPDYLHIPPEWEIGSLRPQYLAAVDEAEAACEELDVALSALLAEMHRQGRSLSAASSRVGDQ